MTYKFNKEQHITKIKAGMKAAKKAGKKLGRPKDMPLKGEDIVLIYLTRNEMLKDFFWDYPPEVSEIKLMTRQEIADMAEVSVRTVQRIVNKYKKK